MQAKARETAARVAVEATGVGLSREARTRLSWMDFYRETKNAALTCRRFGIARQTFYGWQRRYDPMDLTSLESGSHVPGDAARPTWSFLLESKVWELRLQPVLSKSAQFTDIVIGVRPEPVAEQSSK